MRKTDKYSECQICKNTEERQILKGVFCSLDQKFRCYRCYKKFERIKNQDQYKNYRKEYYQKNIEKINAKNKKYQNTIKYAYAKLVYRAKNDLKDKRHLTFEEFKNIISKPCHYCGEHSKFGIDRADNSIGYTFDNCRSCCWKCNKTKRDILTEEQFIIALKAVNDFHRTENKLPKLNISLQTPILYSRDRKGWEYWYLTHDSQGKPREVFISESEYYYFRNIVNNNQCSYCTSELPNGSYCLDKINPNGKYTLDN